MASLNVNPSAVGFAPTLVGNSVTKSSVVTVTNTTGSTIKLTGVAYGPAGGDLATYPVGGFFPQTSFTLAPHSAIFPISLTAGSSQAFDVTFAPSKSEGGTDTRSLVAYILNSANAPCAVNIGGGVQYPASVVPTVSPLYQGSGTATPGQNVGGMGAMMNISDLDTARHYSPVYLLGTPHFVESTVSTQAGTTSDLDPLIPKLVPGTGITTATTGSYESTNARSVAITVQFGAWATGAGTVPGATITIEQKDGSDTVVFSQAVTATGQLTFFLGNNEGINLKGYQIRAVSSSHVDATPIWVSAVVTS